MLTLSIYIYIAHGPGPRASKRIQGLQTFCPLHHTSIEYFSACLIGVVELGFPRKTIVVDSKQVPQEKVGKRTNSQRELRGR